MHQLYQEFKRTVMRVRPGARRRLGPDVDAQAAPLAFPCTFPIKVMGRREAGSRRR
jgi:hypothetical protein